MPPDVPRDPSTAHLAGRVPAGHHHRREEAMLAFTRNLSLGKKITREKSIRTGMVSLSEYDYLGGKD